MGIYKRGKVYWYRFMWQGQEVRESSKQGNDKVARNMESAHRTSLAKGEVGIREKKVAPTFKDFCEKRIEPYAKPRQSWIWYRAGMRALLKYDMLASARLDEIKGETAAGFAAWRLGQEITPASINGNLRVLRRILRLALNWGVIDAAPKIEMLTGEARRERVVTPDEEGAYLAQATPLLTDVATVLFDTGLRPDELHRMEWPHITWPNGRHGTILVIKGKTGAARRLIPMTPRVLAVLEQRWKAQGKPTQGWAWPADTKSGHMDHSTLRRPHKAALKESKVTPFVLYSARHTFLTRLGASGCDVWTLMRIAGHSSITISSRYVHPHADTIDRAFAALAGQPAKTIANAGRHKTRHSGKSGKPRVERKMARNVREYRGELVSAAGFEPATHALKGVGGSQTKHLQVLLGPLSKLL
jgi:integrase